LQKKIVIVGNELNLTGTILTFPASLENIYTKNSRSFVATAKFVSFDNFTLNLKMTKLNRQK